MGEVTIHGLKIADNCSSGIVISHDVLVIIIHQSQRIDDYTRTESSGRPRNASRKLSEMSA